MRRLILVFLLLLAVDNATAQALELSLSKAIARAKEVYFDLKSAKFKDKVYQELAGEYMREYFPKLGLGFSNELSRVQRGMDTRSNKIQIQAQQMIYDGGKISGAKELLRLERQLNFLETVSLENNIGIKVLQQFFELLGFNKKIEIQLEFLSSLEGQLLITEEELRLGEITKLDYLEIGTKVEDERFNLTKIKSAYYLSAGVFRSLLKIESETQLVLDHPMLKSYANQNLKNIKEHYNLEKIINYGINKKKESAAFYLQYKKSQREIEALQGSIFPAVSLVGSFNLEGEEMPRNKSYQVALVLSFAFGGSNLQVNDSLNNFSNGQGKSMTQGVNLAVLDNISVWGSQYLQSQLAQFSISEAQKDFQRQYKIGISSLYENLCTLYESYLIMQKKVKILEARIALAQTKLELGEIKRVDFVNMKLESLKTNLEMINILVDFTVYSAQLEAETGVPLGFYQLY
jgi:outer membrane protein TolC